MNIEIPNNISESAAAEIQAIIDRETKAKGTAFVPKDGDQYWFINRKGKVIDTRFAVWVSDLTDKYAFIFGNCYPTREAAVAAAPAYIGKIDAEFAIKRWIAEHQNWLSTDEEKADSLEYKHYVDYSHLSASLDSNWWQVHEPFGIASFRTREYAEQFIAECGDHLRVVHGLPTEEAK